MCIDSHLGIGLGKLQKILNNEKIDYPLGQSLWDWLNQGRIEPQALPTYFAACFLSTLFDAQSFDDFKIFFCKTDLPIFERSWFYHALHVTFYGPCEKGDLVDLEASLGRRSFFESYFCGLLLKLAYSLWNAQCKNFGDVCLLRRKNRLVLQGTLRNQSEDIKEIQKIFTSIGDMMKIKTEFHLKPM